MAVGRRTPTRHRAPIPVFAAAGVGGWGPAQELRGAPELRLVTTPRHAAVLLVTGSVPDGHLVALRRVHDQVPHPRAVVAWRTAGAATRIPATVEVAGDGAAVVTAVQRAWTALDADPSATAADQLPDVEPNEWRGVGPYGQGGEGMMGGTPYGRPMAMTGDDPDGLALDELHLTLGPFLDPLPAGLTLDVVMQGEVLREAEVRLDAPTAADTPAGSDRAAASARHGLQWLAHALHVEGLDALAAHAAALAARVTGDGDRGALSRRAEALARRVRRTGVLRTLRGVGVVEPAGDAAARWQARLDVIAGALRDDHAPAVLDPTGPAIACDLLPRVLPGSTLTDAISTIVSLDIDVAHREAGLRR